MSQDKLSNHARSVIDSNRYMALGTADEAGHPWVSPVWFASEDYRNFHWYSQGAHKAIYRDPDGNEIGFGGVPAGAS
jgi:hypothetical protein